MIDEKEYLVLCFFISLLIHEKDMLETDPDKKEILLETIMEHNDEEL